MTESYPGDMTLKSDPKDNDKKTKRQKDKKTKR